MCLLGAGDSPLAEKKRDVLIVILIVAIVAHISNPLSFGAFACHALIVASIVASIVAQTIKKKDGGYMLSCHGLPRLCHALIVAQKRGIDKTDGVCFFNISVKQPTRQSSRQIGEKK